MADCLREKGRKEEKRIKEREEKGIVPINGENFQWNYSASNKSLLGSAKSLSLTRLLNAV